MLAVFKSKEIVEFVSKEEKDYAHRGKERDSSGTAYVFLNLWDRRCCWRTSRCWREGRKRGARRSGEPVVFIWRVV